MAICSHDNERSNIGASKRPACTTCTTAHTPHTHTHTHRHTHATHTHTHTHTHARHTHALIKRGGSTEPNRPSQTDSASGNDNSRSLAAKNAKTHILGSHGVFQPPPPTLPPYRRSVSLRWYRHPHNNSNTRLFPWQRPSRAHVTRTEPGFGAGRRGRRPRVARGPRAPPGGVRPPGVRPPPEPTRIRRSDDKDPTTAAHLLPGKRSLRIHIHDHAMKQQNRSAQLCSRIICEHTKELERIQSTSIRLGVFSPQVQAPPLVVGDPLRAEAPTGPGCLSFGGPTPKTGPWGSS